MTCSQDNKIQFFQKTLRERWQTLLRQDPPRRDYQKNLGKTFSIPITHLIPGQTRFSYQLVKRKIKKLKGSYPVFTPKKCVLTAHGPLLLDGHHHVLLALYLGMTTFPVHLEGDFSSLSPSILYQDAHGRQEPFPFSFWEMQDDPNRYFLHLVCLKVEKAEGPAESKTKLWVKGQEAPPFIEFHLGDILHRAGLHYRPAWGKQVPEFFLQKTWGLLHWEKSQGNPLLQQVELLPPPSLIPAQSPPWWRILVNNGQEGALIPRKTF